MATDTTPSSTGSPKRKIVIIGITGRQGGALCEHLYKKMDTWDIHGITRDLESEHSKALLSKFPLIHLHKGDCLDTASLESAFTNAYAVFGVTNPFVARWTGSGNAHTDTDAEVVQGKNIVDACKKCNVKHYVFTSVASAQDNTGVPTFDAKWEIEKYIQESKIPCTIIAPVGFFENMLSPFAGLKQGVMPGLLKPGRTAQMIAVTDIGYFAMNALENPSEWIGKRFEIAGDDMTMDEQCNIIAKVRHEEGQWKVSTPPDWVFKLFIPKAVGSLKKFLDEKGCHVDIKECRKVHPELLSFEKWLYSQGLDKAKLASPGWCVIQ